MFSIDVFSLVATAVGVPCKILVMFSMKNTENILTIVGVPCKILVMFSFIILNSSSFGLEYPAKF